MTLANEMLVLRERLAKQRDRAGEIASGVQRRCDQVQARRNPQMLSPEQLPVHVQRLTGGLFGGGKVAFQPKDRAEAAQALGDEGVRRGEHLPVEGQGLARERLCFVHPPLLCREEIGEVVQADGHAWMGVAERLPFGGERAPIERL